MCHLTTGTPLRNALLGNFVDGRTFIEYSYPNLDGLAYYMPSLYVEPVAPRPQACLASYCTKQHKIKSSTRENDAVKVTVIARFMRLLSV